MLEGRMNFKLISIAMPAAAVIVKALRKRPRKYSSFSFIMPIAAAVAIMPARDWACHRSKILRIDAINGMT